ncbi:MAG: monooxygenase [Polyangiales bacterium]
MRFALVFPLLFAACSSSSNAPENPATDAGATDSGASDLSTIKMQMDVTVPAGKEIFRCQMVKLPLAIDGDPEIFVQSTAHDYTPGSHHYLVFRTTLTDVPTGLDKPFDCAEGDGVMTKYATGYVFGGQVPKEERKLPDGIALPLKSYEILALQAHYINASSKDLDASVHVEMRTIPKAQVKDRAGIYRMYDPYIHIAPKSAGTAQMRCPVKHDITVVAASPHMHVRGQTETAWLDVGDTKAATPFLTNDDWQHPKEFTGPMAVKAGSFFRFQCAYKNDEDRNVYQGQSATDEMCMLSAFYYPAMPAADEYCFTDADQLGAGTTTCADTTKCVQGCPAGETPRPAPGLTGVDVGPCFQQCIVDSCPNATGPLFKQFACIQANCKTECAPPATDCLSCAVSKCSDSVTACQSLACDK